MCAVPTGPALHDVRCTEVTGASMHGNGTKCIEMRERKWADARNVLYQCVFTAHGGAAVQHPGQWAGGGGLATTFAHREALPGGKAL